MNRLLLTYVVIWAYTITAAFLFSAFGIGLMGDPQSALVSGEMSKIATLCMAVSLPLHGALLMLRRPTDAYDAKTSGALA